MPSTRPPQLTIRLTGKTENVLFSTLLEVGRETLEILREIDREVTHDEQGSMEWEVIGVSLNSPLALQVRPVITTSPFDERAKVVNAYMSGINKLNTRTAKPRYFNDRALQHTKNLAKTYEDGALRIEYKVGNRSAIPKPSIVRHVDAILSPPVSDVERVRSPRKEFGSLQGVVTILKAGQHDSFTIKETLNSCEVRCLFSESLEQDVRAAWKTRVRAYGKISYSADGIPLDIEVEKLIVLKPVESLPQFKDFSIDITGGMDSVEYVRSMRDA